MTRTLYLAVLTIIAICGVTFAGEMAKHCNLDKNGLALKGYDPVSYFTADKPIEGNPKITTTYEGATYRFATDQNKQMFEGDPKKYLPEYGGWCAKALADNKFVDIDPTSYKITDGRLFLFYKGFLGDALKIWNKDEANLKMRADANWKEIEAK